MRRKIGLQLWKYRWAAARGWTERKKLLVPMNTCTEKRVAATTFHNNSCSKKIVSRSRYTGQNTIASSRTLFATVGAVENGMLSA